MSVPGNSDSQPSSPSEKGIISGSSGNPSSTDPFKRALDQSRDGVMLVKIPKNEVRLEIIYANARMALIAGFLPNVPLESVNFAQLVSQSTDFVQLTSSFTKAAKEGGAVWVGELVHLLTKKSHLCEWRIRGVQDEFGRLEYFIVTIIESVPKEGALEVKSSDHDESRRLRNDNLASLSLGVLHDLNNLLGIIMTNLSTMLHHKGEGGVEFIRGALVAAQQAKKYTSQVMRSAKGFPMNQEPTDLEVLVREAADIARSGSAVDIKIEVDPSLKWVVVDAAEISQVFQNIVINGIESMERVGKMDIQLRNVQIPSNHKELAEGAYVEVLFRDRGVGMTPEELEKVNEGFFTTKAQGNGIGLTTCRRIVQSHHGLLQLSSMKNVGTEVTILLPATSLTSTLAKRQQDHGALKSLRKGSGSILVVEDETGLRQINMNVLKKCGYRTIEATNGSDAIDMYRQLMREDKEVDLVLMDLTLQGGISGEDAMKAIKSMNPAAKIIATSGSLVEESLEQYVRKGFCDILPKPYEAHELAGVVYRNLFGQEGN